MTTETLPRPGWAWRARRAFGTVLSVTVSVIAPQLRVTVPATARHLRDHAYSIVGLGLISGAAFVHSLFAGLLVTGVLFLVFEWKVSE